MSGMIEQVGSSGITTTPVPGMDVWPPEVKTGWFAVLGLNSWKFL